MFGKHLLGIYEKAFDPRDSWEQRLMKAKQLGFDYMEISIDEKDERIARLYWSRNEIEQLRRTCAEVGIPILSMCLSAHRRFPFGSSEEHIRQKAHDIMEKAIFFASAMGIRTIQLAGYDVYYEVSSPESVERFREGMRWAAKLAEQNQVMLAMEIMDTPFMNSISKHLVYEEDIRSPWYRVYPDLGNLSAWPENNPQAEIEKGIHSVVAVHLKDTIPPSGDKPGVFKCVPFGEGCVDFEACFKQLENLDYSGPYMIEMWYGEEACDVEKVRESKIWLQEKFDKAMEALRENA